EYLTGGVCHEDEDQSCPGERLLCDSSALLNSKPCAAKNDASADDVIAEAKRCLNCGCVAVSPSDVAPALLTLRARMITTKREIPAEEFFEAGIESSTVLEKGEILKELWIPAETAGNVQLYQKFRTRKTIDFPIAGLAANLTVKNGVIESAKLAFNGAAPVPFALTETEEFLTGKKPDEETASAAGRLAVKDMTALAENGFKLRIFQTFVKRAILGEGCK
ncbi:MAG: FAD binding domain-containing protein, partial [Oscillospiraceae bacterium]|nr:FAD binding domain-containing protein [Oscillospiraceae bacterium]